MPIKIGKILLSSFACYLLSLPAIATTKNSELMISNAYMPKVPPVSRTAAVYLTIKNPTDQSFVLMAISSDISRHAMMHQTVTKEGMVKMSHQPSLMIQAGETIQFTPGAKHIMLMGLQKPLPIKKFNLQLIFEHHEKQTVEVDVVSNIINNSEEE